MGNLFTSLINSTGALRVYGRQFNVLQNNITNANTPGYVKQDQVLLSLPFDLTRGMAGGVVAGPMVNARSSSSNSPSAHRTNCSARRSSTRMTWESSRVSSISRPPSASPVH